MVTTRVDQMVERLRSIQAAAPDIEASAIVSVDGLMMVMALQQSLGGTAFPPSPRRR